MSEATTNDKFSYRTSDFNPCPRPCDSVVGKSFLFD